MTPKLAPAIALVLFGQMAGSAEMALAGDKITSEETGAAVTGKPGNVIDSTDLANFDKCRAAIDFTKSIEEVQAKVANCKQIAREKSRPLEHMNFGDVKQKIDDQRLMEQQSR